MLTSRTVTVHSLGPNDYRVLDAVTGSAIALGEQGWQAQATVAFVDVLGFAHVGPVRSARRHPSQEVRYEVVVAGAVFDVPVDQILAVNWGIPVPEHGQPSVTLEVTGRGLVRVDPERAGSLGCIPWNLTYRPRGERAEDFATV